MHRKGFAVIPFVIVAAVTLITATVVYRTSNQRQTTSSQAAVTSDSTWAQVKAINNVVPWTSGGPTAVWESYVPNINLQRLYACNTKYCWVYDRTAQQWLNSGNGFDMSTDAGYAVQAGPGGVLPWTSGGPTAAWTWTVKSNDPTVFFNLPNGTELQETLICNKKVCWRNIRYPGTPPSGVPVSKWRDNGVGKNMHELNSFWNFLTQSTLGVQYNTYGITAAWTNPVTKIATLCSKTICWNLDYANWAWKAQENAYPKGISEYTSAWISHTTKWLYLCNAEKCWTKDATSNTWLNNGNPTYLYVPPTATPRPTALSTPPATPQPTATRAPSPTPRPTAIPTDVAPRTISTVTTDSIWAQTRAISNTFPWTNGGPTAAWESYIPNISLNRLYICNTKYCWTYDRTAQQWLNSGNGFDMSTDAGYAVQAGPGGVKPWSNNGPTAAWTWLVKSNNPTEFFNLPNGTELQETIICNKTICWRNIRYPGNPPAGVPASKWRDNGAAINISTLNSFWTDTRVRGLWSGDGLTSAWTDRVNKRTTLCNHSYCWSIDNANNGFVWRFQVSPFPAGVTEYTAAWTSHLTNLEYLCNRERCWQFNITQNAWQNNGNPIALYVPPTATPTTPVDILANCAPTRVSPAEGAIVTGTPTLQWNGCTGVTFYRILLSGGTINYDSRAITGTSKAMSGFTFRAGNTFTWKVQACADGSCSRATAWSPNYTFRSPTVTVAPTIPPTATVAPTTRPTTIATQIPPTVIPTTPPSPQDATINFAVEYVGIASSKTQLPAVETQVKIMNGTAVLKTANVLLQRRSSSDIFEPTQAISVPVPAAGLNRVTVEIKHLTSTTLTVNNVNLVSGQLATLSTNGEGKLYGGDVNGFNACTNCSFGLIDSYDLNNFLEAYNANRVDNTVDFNRDGAVTLADFGLLAQNYNKVAQTINLRTRDE